MPKEAPGNGTDFHLLLLRLLLRSSRRPARFPSQFWRMAFTWERSCPYTQLSGLKGDVCVCLVCEAISSWRQEEGVKVPMGLFTLFGVQMQRVLQMCPSGCGRSAILAAQWHRERRRRGDEEQPGEAQGSRVPLMAVLQHDATLSYHSEATPATFMLEKTRLNHHPTL